MLVILLFGQSLNFQIIYVFYKTQLLLKRFLTLCKGEGRELIPKSTILNQQCSCRNRLSVAIEEFEIIHRSNF